MRRQQRNTQWRWITNDCTVCEKRGCSLKSRICFCIMIMMPGHPFNLTENFSDITSLHLLKNCLRGLVNLNSLFKNKVIQTKIINFTDSLQAAMYRCITVYYDFHTCSRKAKNEPIILNRPAFLKGFYSLCDLKIGSIYFLKQWASVLLHYVVLLCNYVYTC